MQTRLRRQQKVLNEQIDIESRKVLPTDLRNQGRADTASDNAFYTHHMSLLERLKEQYAEVNKAIKRIEDHTYGICTNCGNAIMSERLEALPYTALCINCQRKADGKFDR